MIRCRLCGHSNAVGRSVCGGCGETLTHAGRVAREPWPSYVPLILTFRGPAAAVVISSGVMAITPPHDDPSDVFLLCLFAGSALPFSGGLMMVRHNMTARAALAILFAVCGFIVSAFGAFVAYLLAGMPGFRMD